MNRSAFLIREREREGGEERRGQEAVIEYKCIACKHHGTMLQTELFPISNNGRDSQRDNKYLSIYTVSNWSAGRRLCGDFAVI